jgi:hypothetical protein
MRSSIASKRRTASASAAPAAGAPRQVGELAFVRLLEGHALGIDAVEIAPYRRIVEAAIEVGEIPFRQSAKRRFGTRSTALGRPLDGDFFRCGTGHALGDPHRP